MTRNWGLPPKDKQSAFRRAKDGKPVLTLLVSAVFGVIGAAVAATSFAEARAAIANLFHGGTLIASIVAAGFGCWAYIWLARPRFAAHFSGDADPFSSLIRFYARAAVFLVGLLLVGQGIDAIAPNILSVTLLCISGGAGAAAAFQTVLAFVPRYET
ncbi:MAG: hypothetical protein ACX939_05240 [Hyphococcus sp.]